MDTTGFDHIINPSKRQNKTTKGEGIFESCKTINVPAITTILITLIAVIVTIETSFNKYKVAAHIIPTTTALMPSSDL